MHGENMIIAVMGLSSDRQIEVRRQFLQETPGLNHANYSECAHFGHL